MEKNKVFGQIVHIIRCTGLLVVLIVAGCGSLHLPRIAFRSSEHRPQEDPLAYGPDVNAIAVYNDYAPGAIRATGGYQSWIETVKIELDCLVTFYKPDGSFYVTEQKHRIYPWSNSIALSADEPKGKFSSLLSRLRLSASPRQARAKSAAGLTTAAAQFERHGTALPLEYLTERDFAEGSLELMTAPARLLDAQAAFSKGPQPVRIDGMWYDPVERKTTSAETTMGAVFYQNRQNSLVDVIRYSDTSSNKFFTVRGYGYKKIKNSGVSVPRKIDIFRTDAGGVQQQLLASIDYNLP
jgi:hypothetical protein